MFGWGCEWVIYSKGSVVREESFGGDERRTEVGVDDD